MPPDLLLLFFVAGFAVGVGAAILLGDEALRWRERWTDGSLTRARAQLDAATEDHRLAEDLLRRAQEVSAEADRLRAEAARDRELAAEVLDAAEHVQRSVLTLGEVAVAFRLKDLPRVDLGQPPQLTPTTDPEEGA